MDNLGTALVLAQGDDPEPTPPSDPLGGLMLPLVLGFVFIYFFLIRPQRREQDDKRRLLESLKKNDRVITTGGMYGTIVNLKDDEVTLRVDDQAKVKIRLLKSAIARVVEGSSSSDPDESKKS